MGRAIGGAGEGAASASAGAALAASMGLWGAGTGLVWLAFRAAKAKWEGHC